MSFSLLGIDFSCVYRNFGIVICQLTSMDTGEPRSLFTIYWADGTWIIELFWHRFLVY